MNKELCLLALQRVRELGQEAKAAHHEIEKWRDPKLSDMERTLLSVKLNGSLDEQHKWLIAVEEELEKRE